MKKLGLIIFISILIMSCTNKQDILDKCIAQGNEIFAKDDTRAKGYFVYSCVLSTQKYHLNSGCDVNKSPSDYFVAMCYVNQDGHL